MSGPSSDGNPPPEVPEQFADAYRRAYADAMAAEPAPAPVLQPIPDAATGGGREPESTPSVGVPPGGSHRAAAPVVEGPSAAERWAGVRDSRWFLPALLVAAALFLILFAYVLGRMISGGGGDEAPAVQQSSATETTTPSPKVHPARGKNYQGAVVPLKPTQASAKCTSAPGVDSAGNRVVYDARNMIDEKTDTAWRCDGTAVGQIVSFTLPSAVGIGEVGLIPGYAKTDPDSGDDRYAENNRITKVRWIFSDGTSVDQTMSADPKDRSMRTIRVPATKTTSVRLQILAVETGSRNTTAISEVRIGAVS